MGSSVGLWGNYSLKKGNSLHYFKNHSQLPNAFILSSFFITFLITSISTELIFDSFKVLWSNKWFYLGGSVGYWGRATAWNRGIPFKILRITHNHLIFFILSSFLINFLYISGSAELILDSIKFFWSKIWGSLGESVGYWEIYILKQGNTFKKIQSLTTT